MNTQTKTHFTSRETPGVDSYRAVNEASRERFDAIWDSRSDLTPADAVRLAQRLLVAVLEDGIGYGDFQSPQATERYVKKARTALKGLPLHP